MISVSAPQDLKRLRRIAISAQGLSNKNHFGKGLKAIQKAVSHLGYVQLDTISVVERAHHHVMFSRVGHYQVDMLNQLLQQRKIFEYWSHAAAYLPIQDYRFSLPYKHAIKSGQTHWHKTKDTVLMDELLCRIKTEGPLRSRDIQSAKKKNSGWWDWKPAKKALEQLFMEGDLMVSDRTGFQKTYDLSARVLPQNIDTRMPSIEEYAEHMLTSQLRCHGLVSRQGLTYLRRNTALKKAVGELIQERLANCELETISLTNGEIYYVASGALEQSLPRVSRDLSILSPFDNLVIQRSRLKSIFQFDYQIECYVPQGKRQYGYFSLPLLYKDSFVGQMDCKVHRKTKVLEIKSLHFSNQLTLDRSLFASSQSGELVASEALMHAFLDALFEFRDFQQCDTINLDNLPSGKTYTHIKRLIKSNYAQG